MPKRQATVLALVCAGHAVSSCFSLNSSDQLCELFGSTPGSWIVWADVGKAPASHLCRTVLTQTWLSNPVSHSSCCSSWGQQCWCEQGKIACLAPFWPAVPVSWADSILTCRSAWLQLACFGTRLSLTYFFSVCGPAWLLSLLLPYALAPHSCLSICMVTQLTPQQHIQFLIVISSFPLWKDHCNPMWSLWYLATLPEERSRERRAKRESLTTMQIFLPVAYSFHFPQLML